MIVDGFGLFFFSTQGAIESLLFVTEKRNGDIKARNVAGGSKQRTYDGYDKKDGASPTVLTESVFLTGVIDAHRSTLMCINHSRQKHTFCEYRWRCSVFFLVPFVSTLLAAVRYVSSLDVSVSSFCHK